MPQNPNIFLPVVWQGWDLRRPGSIRFCMEKWEGAGTPGNPLPYPDRFMGSWRIMNVFPRPLLLHGTKP